MPGFRERNFARVARYGATRSFQFVRSDQFVDLMIATLPVTAAFGALLPVMGPFFGYRIIVLALFAIAVGKRDFVPWQYRSVQAFSGLAGLWVLVGYLSLFWSTDREAATKELFNVTLGLIVCFVLVTRLAKSDSPLKVTTLGWTAAFVVTGGIATYERLTGHHLSNYLAGAAVPARVAERAIASVFGNPNNFAAFLVTAAPFLLLGLTRAKSRARRVLFLTSLVSLSVLLLFTGSRLCLIALGLQGLVAVIFLAQRRHQLIVLSTVVIIAVANLTGIASSLAKSLPFLPQKLFLQGGFAGLTEQLTSTDESGGVRLNLVRDGVWMTTQTHGLGVGAGNFQANVLEGPYPTHGIVDPHNLWIEVLSQYGIIVFLVLVTWLAMVLTVGLRLLRLKREPGTVEARSLGLTIVLSILGNIIAATANSSYLESSVNWVLFGFLGALAVIGERFRSEQFAKHVPDAPRLSADGAEAEPRARVHSSLRHSRMTSGTTGTTAMSKPRVLLLVGYFDSFSGYQETGLAAWLSRFAATEVVAGNRVSPMFSDAQLTVLGVSRLYATGTTEENGVRVTRFSTVELRSMLWSTKVRAYIESQDYDLIVQVMPGQLLPLAGTFARNRATRIVLYGDNSAMWSHHSFGKRLLKGAAFAVSKGTLYSIVNARANHIFGYTPNTVSRLRLFSAGKAMRVLPLTFDADRFYFDQKLRVEKRRELDYHDRDVVVVAAGKIQEKKRLDLLLRAMTELAPSRPWLKLLLTGMDGSADAEELARQVAESAVLAERVKFIGFVGADELNRVFNAADIGVWPRMPAITIQQAMGTGLKVALPKNEFVGHLIRSGTGSYFADDDHDNTTDMERAIADLADDAGDIDDRVVRAETNAWLSAAHVARFVLDDAGFER